MFSQDKEKGEKRRGRKRRGEEKGRKGKAGIEENTAIGTVSPVSLRSGITHSLPITPQRTDVTSQNCLVPPSKETGRKYIYIKKEMEFSSAIKNYMEPCVQFPELLKESREVLGLFCFLTCTKADVVHQPAITTKTPSPSVWGAPSYSLIRLQIMAQIYT